jgi:hypothetical protein
MFEATVIVGIIIAISQFLKAYVPTKYIPVVTMILGVVGGFFFMAHGSTQEAVMNGVLVGLSANGLYDLSKSVHK